MYDGVQGLSEPAPLAMLLLAHFTADHIIYFPVFTDQHALETDAVEYRLRAICSHRGELATSGHYQSFLIAEHGDGCLVTISLATISESIPLSSITVAICSSTNL